jgi:predicted ATPase
MLTGDGLTFGDLLLRHRVTAGLSQEALAERAGLSLRGLSDLERGARRAPYRDTVRRLADALDLGEPERSVLVAASRRQRPAMETPWPVPIRTGLPMPLTSFVGREREVAEVRRLLTTTRLVTLTGTGGVGKTRLALQVAAELVGSYPDGVCLVELAPLADPVVVPQAVASALRVREQPGRPLQQTLADALRDRRLLLVLDNCEHLVTACAELAGALLRFCPDLHILATSREVLRIGGETAWRVPPLKLPPLVSAGPSPATSSPVLLLLQEVERSEAVRLFIARAAVALPGFALTDGNAPTVACICHRLDGLPLAIELAAARVSALGLEQLAARLADRFRLLTGGSRTALPRHQTLRATLEWSYALLAEPEQRLFDRLAVFAGGWTLEAAEAVGAGDGIESADVLELLIHLVDKSLVVAQEGLRGEAWYRLLETLREYGWEGLTRSGGADATLRRHVAFFLALAERAEPELMGAEQRVWLGRLEHQHDNLRAALRWTMESGEAELGLRLAGALGWFWSFHGHYSEGRRWLEGLLGVAGGGGAAALAATRAKALSSAGHLAIYQGDYSRAAALLEESLVMFRDLGDKGGIAGSLLRLGITARYQGDYRRAVALEEESLRLFRDLGDKYGITHTLMNLGAAATDQGDYRRATALEEESLRLSQDLGDKLWSAYALLNLGRIAWYQGDYGRAAAVLEESLTIFRDLGDKRGMALGMEGLAAVACAQEQPERAARLFGAAQAVREAIGMPLFVANYFRVS